MELERLRIEEIERPRLLELERLRLVEMENERLRLVEIENERLRLLEIENERLRLLEIENERLLRFDGTIDIEAKQRQVKQMTQIRLTVGNGIAILKQIRTENKTEFDELINELLISYSDRSAPDQIGKYLSLLTFSQRIDILLNFIDDKYRGNDEVDMKGGAELYKATNN